MTTSRQGGKTKTATRNPSRRTLLAGGAAAIAAFAVPSGGVLAAARRSVIDVHHHFLPPLFARAASANGVLNPALRGLDAARSLEEMDRNGVATAILSIPSPGAGVSGPALAPRVARDANEFAARMVADHPGRFGWCATLPLPDIASSLSELAYALDVLHADAVHLWTNYGDFWLGDARLGPLLSDLNRRRAVVYTHPTTPGCCGKLVPEIPVTVIEYGTDTARTIASLVFSGMASQYPDIRWVFSHAGGSMPALVERFTFQARALAAAGTAARILPNGVEAELQRFYYETAQSTAAPTLAALVRVARKEHILFGSDYPYRTISDGLRGLAAFGFEGDMARAIESGNAERLFKRHAGSVGATLR